MKTAIGKVFLVTGIGVFLLFATGAFAKFKLPLAEMGRGSGSGYHRSYGGSWGGGK